MERKIGEIFEYNGEWYQCLQDEFPVNCGKCCFYNGGFKKCDDETVGECDSKHRTDFREVYFKKLEKVGEPIEFARGLYFQKYQSADSTAFYEGDTRLFFNAPTKTFVYIEIKTKEDMEEKKLNIKPFDIQKAKEGKPVCTRDGRKARIICFDRNDNTPIVALIECVNHVEILQCYYNDGKVYHEAVSNYDLMMLPEKKEGWVNVAKEPLCDDEVVLGYIFNSYEDAVRSGKANERYVATVRIEWEG